MSKATQIDLLKLVLTKLETFTDEEDAAKWFGVGVNKIRKWRGGTGFPEVSQCQRVLDEAFKGDFKAPVAKSSNLVTVLGEEYEAVLDKTAATLNDNGAASIRIVAMPGSPVDVQVFAVNIADLATKAKPKGEVAEEPEVKLADLGPLAAKAGIIAPASDAPASEFAIMLPTHRDYPQAVMFSIVGNWKATLPEAIRAGLCKFDGEPDTLIHVARNVLAHRFMQGNARWAYWQDSDVIASFGNPGWFKKNAGGTYKDEFLSTAAINRLRSRDKTLIGACYSTRNGEGAIVAHGNFGTAKGPATEILNEVRRHGPKDKIVETAWFGFGCCLVHRSVFDDIAKLPDTPKYPDGSFGYFDPIPGLGSGAADGQQAGEDIAFCKRAKDAGHQPWLDLSLICGHVGRSSFLPHQ